MNSQQPSQMRKLSVLENYFWQRSKSGYHPGFIISVTLNKPIPDETLTEAIRLAGVEYPMLFQQICEEDKKWPSRLVPICKRLVTSHLIVHVDNDDPNHLFNTHKLEVTDNNCSWVIFVKGNRLSLMANHTLFDGMSVYNAWDAIIKYANKGVKSTNRLIYDARAEFIKEPHAFDQLKQSVGQRFKAKIAPYWILYGDPLVSNLIPRQDFRIQGFDVQSSLFDSSRNIVHDDERFRWNIPPEQLTFLLEDCRSRNMSLTAWICAKITKQLSKIKAETEGKITRIQVPMNVRPFLSNELSKDPKTLAVGNYITGCELEVNMEDVTEDIWRLGSGLNEQLMKYKNDPLSTIDYAKLLEQVDTRSFLDSKYAVHNPDFSFELSNLGVFNPSSPDDTYQVLDAQFHLPKLPASIFNCSAVSTRLGGLTVIISYPKNLRDMLRPLFEALQQ